MQKRSVQNARAMSKLSVLSVAVVLFSAATLADTAHDTTVKVLYAGSLAHVMQQGLRPAFEANTNDTFVGFAAGSNTLASEIKGKVRRGDVFVSAHPDVNQKLMGRANGNWVAWYATFMKSPLVIGYNPESRFASALKSKPWYQVLSQSAIGVGRTDPKLDPKGKLIVQAADQIAKKQGQPGLQQKILAHAPVYPENALVGRLQSGQIDAGFFYRGEAVAAGIPTVSITPVALGAIYTISVLERAPHKAGAVDFVKFVVGQQGKRVLEKNGFEVLDSIKLSGHEPAIPDALRSALGSD